MTDSTILVGHKGLVGSAFARAFNNAGCPFETLTRRDMVNIQRQDCDLLILSIGNANKTRAIADPGFDFQESVASVARYIHAIQANMTVLISSVDVYDDPGDLVRTREDVEVRTEDLHTYGFHKRLAELCVQKFAASSYLICRLPGLVGPGLQKNAVYDNITPEKKLFIDGQSALNFIHTDFVAQIILALTEAGDRQGIYNIAAGNSIMIDELPKLTGMPNSFAESAKDNIQRYQINTDKIAGLLKVPSSEESISRYVSEIRS